MIAATSLLAPAPVAPVIPDGAIMAGFDAMLASLAPPVAASIVGPSSSVPPLPAPSPALPAMTFVDGTLPATLPVVAAAPAMLPPVVPARATPVGLPAVPPPAAETDIVAAGDSAPTDEASTLDAEADVSAADAATIAPGLSPLAPAPPAMPSAVVIAPPQPGRDRTVDAPAASRPYVAAAMPTLDAVRPPAVGSAAPASAIPDSDRGAGAVSTGQGAGIGQATPTAPLPAAVERVITPPIAEAFTPTDVAPAPAPPTGARKASVVADVVPAPVGDPSLGRLFDRAAVSRRPVPPAAPIGALAAQAGVVPAAPAVLADAGQTAPPAVVSLDDPAPVDRAVADTRATPTVVPTMPLPARLVVTASGPDAPAGTDRRAEGTAVGAPSVPPVAFVSAPPASAASLPAGTAAPIDRPSELSITRPEATDRMVSVRQAADFDRPAPIDAPPSITAAADAFASVASKPPTNPAALPSRATVVATVSNLPPIAVPTPAAPPATGIDLDAIFPPGGDAPLTIAFARPASPTRAAPVRLAEDATDPAGAILPPFVDAAPVADRTADLPAAASAAPTVTLAPPPVAVASGDATLATAGSAPAAAPVEVAIQHHLIVAHDGAWLDRLARDIAASADKDARMRFQLNPERLGSLHVEIAHTAGGASVRFSADSEAARALIADAQPRLVAEARAQGMKIADTQVDLSGQNSGGPSQGGAANPFAQQQRQQAGQQRAPVFNQPATTRSRPAAPVASAAARAERYA